MLKNYFKIAIAVLKRRKFFTFISLFGISFTLTILIVLTSFLDHLLSPQYPDTKRNQSLYISTMIRTHSTRQSFSNGPMSIHFLNKYVYTMKTPAKVGIASIFTATNTYVNNKKLNIDVKYTNAEFWEVNEFRFLEGRPYTAQEITNGDHVAVISERTRQDYFGDASAVGKYIETDNERYRVTGVVKSVPITLLFCYGDMYLPYTLSKSNRNNTDLGGEYFAVLQGRSAADLPKMAAEYQQVIARYPLNSDEFDKIHSFADTYLASFTRTMMGTDEKSGTARFMLGLSLVVLFILLLPTLNLININISRIMERSSEIGVRKAFGASSRTLVYQFIIENIILTLIGGLLGLAFSATIIAILNHSQVLPSMYLTINFTVLLWTLAACLLLGLFSGVYPAWRMSRLQVVTALKAS
ncbi:ABC transporter permease [Paraflavitalea sp. CAU 1676]|uniref:ABC transporter permease n=1 Tax=Paraflavitalea sp. CAU 1676 TaxID=3032598 RepID=UPI0023DCDEF7|nr:ABC transporter permease [Paraflavitalea sp. CAU 1676]MDF2191124.1 ABC transporter permease [Paraflavitalea sp. CAU 1676]